MEELDEFFETINSNFDWEGFIQPTELEDAFQSVLQKENFENVLPQPSLDFPPPQPPLYFPPLQPPLSNVPSDVNKIDDHKRKSDKRFAPSLNATEIQQLSVHFVPKTWKKNNQWALHNFSDWICFDHHNQENPHDTCTSDILKTCSAKELNRWLSIYMTATRKVDGGKYTLKTINCLLAGVLREIRSTNNNSHLLNFMNMKDFKEFRVKIRLIYEAVRIQLMYEAVRIRLMYEAVRIRLLFCVLYFCFEGAVDRFI